MENKKDRKLQRKRRTRVKIARTASLPRLSVFRSNRHIYAQIIAKGQTIVAVSDRSLSDRSLSDKGTKSQVAESVGRQLAREAKSKHISKVVFDRGAYKYRGRVKSLAEGARKGGLTF